MCLYWHRGIFKHKIYRHNFGNFKPRFLAPPIWVQILDYFLSCFIHKNCWKSKKSLCLYRLLKKYFVLKSWKLPFLLLLKKKTKRNKALKIPKYWSDGENIWLSLLDLLYEQNILQPFTKYLRLTLVSMWNSALREKVNFCFSRVFS